jgi:hypothetical protein
VKATIIPAIRLLSTRRRKRSPANFRRDRDCGLSGTSSIMTRTGRHPVPASMRVLLLLQLWCYSVHSFIDTDGGYFRRLGLSDPFGRYSIETSSDRRPSAFLSHRYRRIRLSLLTASRSSSQEKDEFLRKTGEGALNIVKQLGQLTQDKPLLSENYFGKRKIGIGSIFTLADADDRRSSPSIGSTNQQQLSKPDEMAGDNKEAWQALANLESES